MVIRNRGHLFRLIGLHSMILIHMLIPLPYLQKLPEHLQPLWLQLPGIHQLLVVLPPGPHIALLRHKLGRFAMVCLQEVNRFLPFGQPEFVLSHCLFHACHQLPHRFPRTVHSRRLAFSGRIPQSGRISRSNAWSQTHGRSICDSKRH